MAETLLSFGVEKLWDLLVRESERLQGVDGQLTALKSDLNLLRSFLKDADAKKHASALVRNCVERIKEIVFDAEDIIETFLIKEELGQSSGIRNRVRRFASIVVDRREISFDMKGIRKRISKVIRDMQSFGVQEMIVDGNEYSHPLQERQREMRHTFSSDNESEFVGLEKNVKKLVGYLVEEESIQVISISGMGGIGKTTLAQQVFNHEMVKNHFDGVVWVCISQQFTRRYVWETILQKLISKQGEHTKSNMTEDELQEKLFRMLETSKSLIILDDMWKEEDWDRIKHVFPPGKGWKVLFTSRNEDVGVRADPTCITFKPECLTPEESWTLLRRIAFPRIGTTEFKVDVEMEGIGKKMLKHCGGLPLAVKVLGGLLAAQHTLSEWKRVEQNIRSHLAGRTSLSDGYRNSVHHVLSLSFEELPNSLKHCFLYLAHFPEDYRISVGKLSYYWAAEGIPKPENYERVSIRDVAYVYIEELVKRNMVMSGRDRGTLRFETCRLHDMMREVCLLKAKDENFLQVVQSTSTANSKSPCKSRRLVLHQPCKTFNLEGEMNNPSLRSLLFIWEHTKIRELTASCLRFSRLQLMRVLDVRLEGGKLHNGIGKLIHLRYLSLAMANVTHLPSSMRNLKQLLYLNIKNSRGPPIYMPNFLKGMRELRYLSLPLAMDKKVKLELANLENLEILENFSTKHSNVTDLQCMTLLRGLSIIFYSEECTWEALSSSLTKLKHLEYLTINDMSDDAREFFLDCSQLKELRLKTNMPRLPDVQHLPSHLASIDLILCRLEEDPMPILEKILELKEVVLGPKSFCGRRMVCSAGGFPQLQRLSFFGLNELEEWIVEEGSMPLLHTLNITDCMSLHELPHGLRFLTSLKYLRMSMIWKERLSERGEDYYKVQHIPSVLYV